MRRTIVLALAVMLGGCSFVFVSGPPANHPQLPYFDCSTSRAAPVLDVVWAVLQLANFGLAVSDSDADWNKMFSTDPNKDAPISRTTAMPLYGALAALGAAGAYYGFTKTAQCREAKNQLILRSVQQPVQPGVGTWPPPQQQPPPPPPPPPPAPPAPPAPAPE